MPGYFTKVEVTDPHRIPQLVWQSIPPGERSLADEQALNSSEFAPLDPRLFRIEPESYRMVWSTATSAGCELRVSRKAARRS
jgi:hypothetical protein